MKINIVFDETKDFIHISSEDGEYEWLGEVWDFEAPSDLMKLLKFLGVEVGYEPKEVHLCPSCNKPCDLYEIDVGIGRGEAWGTPFIHTDIRTVSDCCEAEL